MTKEKLAELRTACDMYAGQPGFVGIAVDRKDLLSLLDALEAKEADFKRMAYLGNLARSRTTEEQDELTTLMRKAAT